MAALHGKTLFITGGSRGIGLATARAFAQSGAAVVLADRDGTLAAKEAAESHGVLSKLSAASSLYQRPT